MKHAVLFSAVFLTPAAIGVAWGLSTAPDMSVAQLLVVTITGFWLLLGVAAAPVIWRGR